MTSFLGTACPRHRWIFPKCRSECRFKDAEWQKETRKRLLFQKGLPRALKPHLNKGCLW